ncbi:Glycolipid transfer protein [Sarcoptes scabiei]|uniref:Glycolipid transfer protein n=2 Tax=Sarcoptes scabiei TaxID=52283 RepID=A0A834R237_SARSC|nr:Glycolipid transfer protein [Sarcoptes scabiei]
MDEKNSTNDSRLFFQIADRFVEINPDVNENNETCEEIETGPFLRASVWIVKFIDMFGIAFKPVKIDIEGNINRLMAIFDSDPSRFRYLSSIVKYEKESIEKSNLSKTEIPIGTDSLRWLNRALLYNQFFLSYLLEDYNNVHNENDLLDLPEDLTKHFENAYERSLKKHHGWFVRKIFKCCLLAIPNRIDLLRYLGFLDLVQLNRMETRNLIRDSLDSYLKQLKSNTEIITRLLQNHGYEP